MARTVSIGTQDFEKMIQRNCFYVDKTYFIKEWWCAYMKSRVRLIPIASIILISSTFSLS